MTDSWWNVYDELGKLLLKHYQKYNDNAGNKLYQILNKSTEFVLINNWIKKFGSNSIVKGFDPLHIYASINGNKLSNRNRLDRINILFKLLGGKNVYHQITFDGCPAPFVITILSARTEESQADIWRLFSRVLTDKNRGVSNEDFNNISSWYGVEITSFTIFLFWIKSNDYLPLDKNVKSFLQAAKLIIREPKNYDEYINIISKIDKYNFNFDHGFGKKGLFREISYFSYIIVNDGKELKNYSNQFNEYYKNEKEVDHGYSSEKSQVELAFEANESNIRTTLNMGFKIVAIKPLKKCKGEYLNNLKPEQIYSLESAFSFEDKTIKYDSKKDITLFNQSDIKINVTAIVGKNGSGKSSLIELLFRLINNIAFSYKNELKTSDLLKYEDNLYAELYYVVNGRLYCLEVKKNEVLIQNYFFKDSVFKIEGSKRNFRLVDFENFFYTVAINYSHYSLNSLQIGDWIDGLFHKNDSYQTPIVINPMRELGNININRENDLVKSRLLVNLFSRVEEEDIGLRQLTEKQKATEVKFTLNLKKNIPKNSFEKVCQNHLTTETKNLIFSKISKYFNFKDGEYSDKNKVIIENKQYIVIKLIKISNTYALYGGYFEKDASIPAFNEAKLDEYIKRLSEDDSHITYKLKQAINYLKYYDLIPKEKEFTFKLDEISEKIDGGYNLEYPELEKTNLIELLPPSIFDIKINVKDNDGLISDFDRLSSGQKQQIHSISSILYHINNLDSIRSKELISYSNIHILLDEIELYYHPEMQRKYLGYFLNMLSKLSLNKINAINICMVTHSPYILSDIPNIFALRLIDGMPQGYQNRTLGSNIHDLLANDFFMEEGFMGELAKKKIEETIFFLNYHEIKKGIKSEKEDENRQKLNDKYDEDISSFELSGISKNHAYHAKIIDLIGEPVIRYRLEDKFNELFKSSKDTAAKRIREIAKEAGLDLNNLQE
tara:strand:- start:1562 stop:4408 length:2847 start_codon:yes stop_codon:yes gene_type:complete